MNLYFHTLKNVPKHSHTNTNPFFNNVIRLFAFLANLFPRRIATIQTQQRQTPWKDDNNYRNILLSDTNSSKILVFMVSQFMRFLMHHESVA